MRRTRQIRGALVAGAWLGVGLAACQAPEAFYRDSGSGTGLGGGPFSGAGGSIVSGSGANIVSGAGGNIVGGSGGDPVSGTGGGGPTGTGGTVGSGGAAGNAGSGGRGGTGGTMGSGGRGGTGGSAGSGGRAGTGGRMGTGGAGGPNSCPLADRIDCTSAGALDLEPDGQVVDFSAAQWNDMNDKWCNALGLDGGVSAFAGMSSTAAAAVDTMAGNLRLNLSVGTGQYAGGRVNFDSCVSLDPMTFDAIQFTASLTAGSLTGCVWQVQIQTQNQRPINQSPSGGMCMTTCERYPAAVNLNAPTANPTTFTVPFSSFNNPSASMIAMASQITGVQWQVNSGSAAPRTCTVELRIDNVRFVNQ